MEPNKVLLEIRDLTVTRHSASGPVVPSGHLNLTLHKGEVLGIVGESGSGKSTVAYAIMGLLEKTAEVSGEILLYPDQTGDSKAVGNAESDAGSFNCGSVSASSPVDLLTLSEKELSEVRGTRIGMVFQNPMRCLDPSFRIGTLLRETQQTHSRISRKDADEKSRELLRRVGFADPDSVMKSYSFELSGGMCQRVMIAMVLLLSPDIIIADEPTTALDVTIQDGIISLLKRICREDGRSMIFITHNFGLVAELCDTVRVLYGGHLVEEGSVDDIFYRSVHPYTRGLLKAIPKAEFSGKQTLSPIEGTPIDLTHMPEGCPFAPRCPHAQERCRKEIPELKQTESIESSDRIADSAIVNSTIVNLTIACPAIAHSAACFLSSDPSDTFGKTQFSSRPSSAEQDFFVKPSMEGGASGEQ